MVDDLPDELFDQERRLVAPVATRGAAWGDPPIVLVCGVGEPEEYDEFSLCIEANGVGWFVPPSQEEDGVDVTITTVGHLPRIAVTIPGEYRPNGLASVMANLSSVVEEHLELVELLRVGRRGSAQEPVSRARASRTSRSTRVG